MNAPAPSRHADISPSAFEKRLFCLGSLAMEKKVGVADQPSLPAAFGTFLHGIAAKAYMAGKPAADYIGQTETVDGFHCALTEDAAATVQSYLDVIAGYAVPGSEVFIEVELDISWITGEEGAVGTSDCVIVRPDGELVVLDLKTGRGEVKAEKNPQLSAYAAAALKAYREGKMPPPVRIHTGTEQVFEAADELEDLL